MKAMIALLLVTGCLVVGCSKKEAPPAEESKPAAATTGVAECDDYLKQVDVCIATNPTQKAQMEQTKLQMTAVFKAMATAPGGKDKLKADCLDHSKLLATTCVKK